MSKKPDRDRELDKDERKDVEGTPPGDGQDGEPKNEKPREVKW